MWRLRNDAILFFCKKKSKFFLGRNPFVGALEWRCILFRSKREEGCFLLSGIRAKRKRYFTQRSNKNNSNFKIAREISACSCVYTYGERTAAGSGEIGIGIVFSTPVRFPSVCVCVTLPPGRRRRRRRGAAIRSHSKGMKGERRRKGEEEQEYGGGKLGYVRFWRKTEGEVGRKTTFPKLKK